MRSILLAAINLTDIPLEEQSVVIINVLFSGQEDLKEIHELIMENRRKLFETNSDFPTPI